LPHCLTPEQIMVDGKAVPDGPVVVFDADGYVAGIGLAERLRREGHDVVYVTPFGNAGSYTMHTGEYPNVARRFHELGIVVMTETMVTSVSPGEVSVEYVFGEGIRHFPAANGQVRPSDHRRVTSIGAGSIVLAGARWSNDELFRGLQVRRHEWDSFGVQGVFSIGDCVAPRHLAEVVFDGHRLAREIDEPDPSVAKPYLRERRLIVAPR
jgi:dimethylamine/trimethylamine dehydrogenase